MKNKNQTGFKCSKVSYIGFWKSNSSWENDKCGNLANFLYLKLPKT